MKNSILLLIALFLVTALGDLTFQNNIVDTNEVQIEYEVNFNLGFSSGYWGSTFRGPGDAKEVEATLTTPSILQ